MLEFRSELGQLSIFGGKKDKEEEVNDLYLLRYAYQRVKIVNIRYYACAKRA